MTAIFWLIDTILELYLWVVIAWVILSWLFVFNIVNRHSYVVGVIEQFLNAIISPVLDPIRRVIPLMGGIDISPLILLLAIQFVRIFIRTSIAPILY